MGEEASGAKRGRPKTFDRERVLDVAVDSYWREGIEAVSLNEICRRARVSKPGLYREFENEDGLMDEALARYYDTVLAPILARTREDRPFRELLAMLVSFVTDPDRGVPLGCLLAKTRLSAPPLGPRAAARIAAIRDASVEAWRAWVVRAQARGELQEALAPDVASSFLDAQFNNLLVQMATDGDPAMLRAHARLAFVGLIGESLNV